MRSLQGMIMHIIYHQNTELRRKLSTMFLGDPNNKERVKEIVKEYTDRVYNRCMEMTENYGEE